MSGLILGMNGKILNNYYC